MEVNKTKVPPPVDSPNNGIPKRGRGRPRTHPLEIEKSADSLAPENLPAYGVEITSTTHETETKRRGRKSKTPNPGSGFEVRISPDKAVYPLSIAADILKLHPRTLRIYEEQELVVPFRTKTQRRRYSQNDIFKLQFVQFLTQKRGVNLSGVKIILIMLEELRKTISDPIKYFFPDFIEME
ncbi:MAG: MerR family transcriptional regulator [Chloroflexi bacterium]|uniref:MerR family transcriptional regulator n=1 Tax=Candidatus Chlorohelix allophototropha TaxID=3003348 RepID=A0A8T7M2V2_9CHLR|nr:MerR family transcriptional regulator [Chloroflexota bacterium]WJW66826.1 MerR family transcriptional regulator [Chloroflexota bacterium L227-S17]